MTNILPQTDKMNRGAWLESEMLIECARDEEALRIIGGAIFSKQGIKFLLLLFHIFILT